MLRCPRRPPPPGRPKAEDTVTGRTGGCAWPARLPSALRSRRRGVRSAALRSGTVALSSWHMFSLNKKMRVSLSLPPKTQRRPAATHAPGRSPDLDFFPLKENGGGIVRERADPGAEARGVRDEPGHRAVLAGGGRGRDTVASCPQTQGDMRIVADGGATTR